MVLNPNKSSDLIAVDIGNSTIHCGRFSLLNAVLPSPDTTLRVATGNNDFSALANWLPPGECRWRAATVHRLAEQRLADWVRNERPQDEYSLLANQDLPIQVNVDYPDRVGADRLLAAIAANCLRTTDRPAIVIDAGTAVTVDAVDAQGVFQGGAILPGLRLSAAALRQGTDALPEVDTAFPEPPAAIGKSTGPAIGSGLFWGQVGAIRELVARMNETFNGDADLIIAGGDAERWAPYLSSTARFVPDIVIRALASLREP